MTIDLKTGWSESPENNFRSIFKEEIDIGMCSIETKSYSTGLHLQNNTK